MSVRSPAPRSLIQTERLRNEDGAIMILALAFLIVILALAVGLLGLAFTGSASLRAYRVERVRRYSADSALVAAVKLVEARPALGVSSILVPCAMEYKVQELMSGNDVTRVFTDTSRLNVTCEVPPEVTNSGDPDPDGTGQLPRDVVFTVTCRYTPPIRARGPLRCGGASATTTMTLGSARVRYDVAPVVDNVTGVTTMVAKVPKILTWSLKG